MFFSLWVVQCIGAGYKSNIYVENSVYATAATQKKPWDCKTSGSYKDYNITLMVVKVLRMHRARVVTTSISFHRNTILIRLMMLLK